MRARLPVTLFVTALGVIASGSAHAQAFPRDSTPRLPVEAPGVPWSHPFSVVAGGGTQRPADGVVAGRADLGRVWTAARDGAGRVVVSSSAGLWSVERDGRLRRITGVPGETGHRDQLAALGDGRVAVSATGSLDVYVIAPGGHRATVLATTADPGPLGIGTGPGGTLAAIAGGRLLTRSGTELVATGPRLWDDDGIREARGIGPVPGGLLVGSLFPNNGVDGDPEGDESALMTISGQADPQTVFDPPAPQSVRKVAVLASGRALVAANASTEGDLDARSLALAAGPHLDRQRFSYGVGEEFYGWIARRRVLVRHVDGKLWRSRWAGPPADDVAADGGGDNVLVASGGRLWSTRPSLGAPGLVGLWRGHVTVRLGAAATVKVTARDRAGRVVASSPARRLPAGRSIVKLRGLPHRGLLRVTIDARDATAEHSTAAWAFAGSRHLSPTEADDVLSAVARRLYIGFESAAAHGVDRCTSLSSLTVRCRWTTAGSSVHPTERTVTIEVRPSGYLLHPSTARPSPRAGRNRHLLGAPFDASA